MCGRIGISIRKTYFDGRHVNLECYGRRRIRKRIKGDCGSFPYI
jgi:hypothetical protein